MTERETALLERISQLENKLAEANVELADTKEELADTKRKLDLLTRQVFGRKSEQTAASDFNQTQLELEIEDAAIETSPAAPPAKPKGGSRRGRKVRTARLPEGLRVEEIVIIPLPVQADPSLWRRIGEQIAELMERVPGRTIIQRFIRPTYVRIDEPYAAPITAPAPPQLIEGGMFGPQFMVDLTLGKYLYHQPLYRQAKGLEWECGIKLSAATLCQTIARIADAVTPVVNAMSDAMWAGGYVQMDLTPVRCLSKEHKGGSFLGQMWVSAVPGGDVIYIWDKSKEAIVAERIVPEWYTGYLQCDGSTEIACFLSGGKGRKRPPPEITRAGCWAHVRRKFFEAARGGCKLAARILKGINVLYRIEQHAREKNFTPEQRARLRQRRARPLIGWLRTVIDTTLLECRPKSAVGRACLYAVGQWESLLVYLECGIMEIDNNSVENAIRPCALGKKNFLFIGDVGAGQRSATLYSLLGSCLRRGINPRAYLSWLFERLPLATNLTVHTLTPAAYAALQAAAKLPNADADQAA